MMLKVPRDDNNPKASEMKKVSEIRYRFYDRRHEMMLLNEAYPHVAFACLIDRYKGSEKQFDPKVHREKLHDLGRADKTLTGLCATLMNVGRIERENLLTSLCFIIFSSFTLIVKC